MADSQNNTTPSADSADRANSPGAEKSRRDSFRRGADAILALHIAAGSTVKDAAAAAGISRKTAFRRMKDSEFRQLVYKMQRRFVDRAIGQLSRAMTRAANVLAKLLDDKSAKVRLAASKTILQFGFHAAECQEVARQIEELREMNREREKPSAGDSLAGAGQAEAPGSP